MESKIHIKTDKAWLPIPPPPSVGHLPQMKPSFGGGLRCGSFLSDGIWSMRVIGANSLPFRGRVPERTLRVVGWRGRVYALGVYFL